MIFFNFKLECDYWRKIAAFFIATSHYNAINSLNTTANHTASDSQLLFACKPFLATKKVSFLQLIEKDETFKGICLDKIIYGNTMSKHRLLSEKGTVTKMP